MKALLIVAHGSRRVASNESLHRLSQKVRNIQSDFDQIGHAFLELAEPSISDGISNLIKTGATHIIVLPYFLAPGRHVVNDVPAEIGTAQAMHPNVKIQLSPHLGCAPDMPEWLISLAKISH